MILTPHAIVGAAIANIVPNEPALGFGLAFLSHYVLDIIPHKDYNINSFMNKKTKKVIPIFNNFKSALSFIYIILDFVVAVFLCAIFFVRDRKSAMLTLIGITAAVLPDIFQFLHYRYKDTPFFKFFQKIHDKLSFDSDKSDMIFGIILQIAIPIIFLTIFFYVTTF